MSLCASMNPSLVMIILTFNPFAAYYTIISRLPQSAFRRSAKLLIDFPHRAKGKKTSEPPVDERKRPAVLYTVHKPDLHAAPVGLGMVVNADL